jgi:hypothetical protein
MGSLLLDFKPIQKAEDPSGGTKEKFDMDKLYEEKAAWEAQNIRTYRFTAKTLFLMPVRPITITVTEGIPVMEDEYDEFELYDKTIPGIYSNIEATIRLHTQEGDSFKFTIKYNEQYHYPEYFYIEPLYDGKPGIGGGEGVEISAFEILEDTH